MDSYTGVNMKDAKLDKGKYYKITERRSTKTRVIIIKILDVDPHVDDYQYTIRGLSDTEKDSWLMQGQSHDGVRIQVHKGDSIEEILEEGLALEI